MANDPRAHQVIELQERGILLVEDGNHGEYRPRQNDFTDKGTAFIRAADMDQGVVLFETASRINDVALARIRKGIGAGGDVLLSHKGTVGKIALTPLDSPPFVCSPQTTFWRTLNTNQLDRKYLYAYMRSAHFHNQLRSRQNETDMAAYVSLTAQRQLEILLPEIKTQRTIGNILGSLDDKIELNRRTNRVLEEMARAIFKAWFVDFEPVKAKAAGASNFPGMPQHVFDQLPNAFVDSELGKIPKGWEVKRADEVADVAIGKTPPRKEPQWFTTHPSNSIRWMSIKDLGECGAYILKTSEYLTEEAIERFNVRRIPDNTVVLSFKLTVGRVAITDGEMLSNEAIAHFKTDSDDDALAPEYLYCYLQSFDYGRLGSTSSIATAVNSKNIKAIPVLVASAEMRDAFREWTREMFSSLKTVQRESTLLASIRDTLLPKLISGEITVPVPNGGCDD